MTATKTATKTTTKASRLGTMVLYTLDEGAATGINERRAARENYTASNVGHDTGAQVHVGNPAAAGQTYPAIIVAEHGDATNLQVFLDGTDNCWATSAQEGTEPGQWAAQETATAE